MSFGSSYSYDSSLGWLSFIGVGDMIAQDCACVHVQATSTQCCQLSHLFSLPMCVLLPPCLSAFCLYLSHSNTVCLCVCLAVYSYHSRHDGAQLFPFIPPFNALSSPSVRFLVRLPVYRSVLITDNLRFLFLSLFLSFLLTNWIQFLFIDMCFTSMLPLCVFADGYPMHPVKHNHKHRASKQVAVFLSCEAL